MEQLFECYICGEEERHENIESCYICHKYFCGCCACKTPEGNVCRKCYDKEFMP